MVGTSKYEGLWTEVMGTLVEVVGRVERRVEEAVKVQFGGMGGWGEVFYPPSAVFTLKVQFKWLGVRGYV